MKLGGVLGLPGGGSPPFVQLVAAGWIRRREYDIAPVDVMGGGETPAHTPRIEPAGGPGGGGERHGCQAGPGPCRPGIWRSSEGSDLKSNPLKQPALPRGFWPS